MRTLLAVLLILAGSLACAQAPRQPSLSYNYAELRYVDVDVNGGDGFEIDRILEKISKGGYDSLTSREKELLFRMGNKK